MGAIVVGLIILTARNVTPTTAPLTASPLPTSLNADVLTKDVNDWRVKNGYQPFIQDQRLCNLANERLPEVKIDYSHKRFWDHTNEFTYIKLGENLGEDWTNEQQLLNAWLQSPEHLANLQYPYTYSCIVTDGSFAVEEFANFANQTATTQSNNQTIGVLTCTQLPPVTDHGSMACGKPGTTPYFCNPLANPAKIQPEPWICGYPNQPNSVLACVFYYPTDDVFPAPISCEKP